MKFRLKKTYILNYVYATIALIAVFWLISIYEVYLSKSAGVNGYSLGTVIFYKLLNDFFSGLVIGVLLFPLYLIIDIFSKKAAIIFTSILFAVFVLLQFSLVKYSITTLTNLGADIFGYSFDDAFSTVAVSESISITYFLPFIIFPVLFFLMYFLLKKYIQVPLIIWIGIVSILVFGGLRLFLVDAKAERFQNKTAYLTTDFVKFIREKNKIDSYNFDGRDDFPLLKPFSNTPDVLSPFFNKSQNKPNIVVIVVEGLGTEFVDGNMYSGYTPYFDELITKSLYWENFVSTTGRSFGILPSLLGSLPYGENGFLDLKEIPSHLSLISVLKVNGYHTSYFSGGPSSFDRKINFLEYNGIDNLIDERKYGSGFVKTKGNDAGFSWGYPDSEIFRKAITSPNLEKQPRLDIIMTISNHEPFEYPDKDLYKAKVDSIVNTSQKPEVLENQILSQSDIFGSLLYTDDSLKDFMEAYSKRPDYDNTIFIITGDHRLIPIEQKDKLTRYHVPFLIYSPMLKAPEKFKSVSSHWDVTPSLLSYLINNYNFSPLKEVAWMGKGLDTVKKFRNIKSIPLMKYKGAINDIIYKEYFLSDNELFKINEHLEVSKINDADINKRITNSLRAFKKMNAYITQRNKIFPDSLNTYYNPKVEFTPEQLTTIKKYSGGKKIDELFQIARDLSFKNEYKTALLLCEYILNEYPNYVDVRILKGRTLAWQKDYANSEDVLLNALKRAPYYDDVYIAILDLYWWSGQEEKSKDIFEQALKNEVVNPEVSFRMAKAYQRIDKVVNAKKMIDSLVLIHPDVSEYTNFKTSLQ